MGLVGSTFKGSAVGISVLPLLNFANSAPLSALNPSHKETPSNLTQRHSNYDQGASRDLALSQCPALDAHANSWSSSFAHHRPGQASLPLNTLPNSSSSNSQSNGPDSPVSLRPSYCHLLGMNIFDGHEPSAQVSSLAQATLSKLQSSYSA